jgi:chromosome segregation ATPase
MFKKTAIVVLALIFASIFPLSVLADDSSNNDYQTQLEQKLAALADQLKSLQAMVKDLSFQVQQGQALQDVVKELSYELKQNESAVHDLQGISDKVNNELAPGLISIRSTIAGMAESFGSTIKAVQGRVFDLETSVEGLDARLKALEGQVRQLVQLEGKVGELDQRLTAVESGVRMPSANANKILDQLKTMQASLDDLSGKLQGLDVKTNGISTSVANLSDMVKQDEAHLATLDTSKANVEDVQTLQTQVKDLQTNLEETKARFAANLTIAALGLLAGLIALAKAFHFI